MNVFTQRPIPTQSITTQMKTAYGQILQQVLSLRIVMKALMNTSLLKPWRREKQVDFHHHYTVVAGTAVHRHFNVLPIIFH